MSLTLTNICKSFGQLMVVKDVNLHVDTGEFIVFVGPSGCGKSTLLRMIAGLEDITSGELHIAGRNVTRLPSADRGIAMVFQSYALYPHLSVYENIAFSLRIAKLAKQKIDEKVRQAADVLQLGSYLDRLPKELSGGQRQRVAIGRAIVRNPEVFLFDEPLSNLDAALRTEMRVELSSLHEKLGSTIVYVTHDQVEAMTLADRIVVLNGGVVEQIGTPIELYLKPRTPFVAGFIGSPKMNLFTHRIGADKGADLCGIRPEDIGISGKASSKEAMSESATIMHVERLGADTLLYVRADSFGDIQIRHPELYDGRVGGKITLEMPYEKFHFFKDGLRQGD